MKDRGKSGTLEVDAGEEWHMAAWHVVVFCHVFAILHNLRNRGQEAQAPK